jgi:16S rRNA (cytosine967-C5)-methyltransferase
MRRPPRPDPPGQPGSYGPRDDDRRHPRSVRAPQQVWSGRRLAFEALLAFETRRAFVGSVLDDLFREHNPAGQERGFATELACGGVRRMITLDLLIETCVTRPREAIEDGLWTLLRLGAYQLLFMPGLAAHAAVHETVELASLIGMPRWQGMINAALRQLQREYVPELGLETQIVDDAQSLTPETMIVSFAPTSARSANTLSAAPAEGDAALEKPRYLAIRLKRAIAGSPRYDWTQYLARTLSYPEWLVGRWRTAYGDDDALRLGVWFNGPGSMFLRVNPLRSDRETLLKAFHKRHVECEPGPSPESIRLTESVPIGGMPEFVRGDFTVQDLSAMSAGALLAPQPGERVWDVCAAPGGKTTHLAEQMRNQGTILATDVHSFRLKLITDACERLGATNVTICLIAPDAHDAPTEEFDAILLDVPCSNTGVLGKRPEARWRLSPSDFQELVPQQKRLLTLALTRLLPGGRIVYSTCSIEPEENSQVVQQTLAAHPEFELVREIAHHPGRPADGGYQALLRRRSVAPLD